MLTPRELAHLLGGEAHGNTVRFPTPGHSAADRGSSVTIDPNAPGGFVVSCFNGADPLELKDFVREKLGLPKWEPNGKGGGRSKTSFVAEYVYLDPEGQPSRKVCRTGDKQFPQFSWSGSKWKAGVKGVPVYPYRLPELIAADTVFVVEGEKDADRLAALGYAATCNPGGASAGKQSKWKPELNQWFSGKTVYIIPDNDEPGRKHAQDIARHLRRVARTARVIELPDLPQKKGADVSDWLDTDPANKGRLLAVAEASRSAAHIDGAVLLQDVYSFLGRFVAYPSEHTHVAHTLWLAHAHLMDAWESTPRVAFVSPEPESGKTRALEITELLVPRPVHAVNATPAYIFRKVADPDGLPTILFDECDTVFGPKAKRDNEEIRGLINAGHRRSGITGRCVLKGKTVETEEIPAYCAVPLAGLGDLPDTILSRSIIIRMRRRAPNERVEAFRERVHRPEGDALRSRLAAWAEPILDIVAAAYPELPPEVVDRQADAWEPLLAIADAGGGEWPKRARIAGVALVANARRDSQSLGVRLLADIKRVFGDRDAMASTDILTALHGLDDAPWADLKGKPLDARGLSHRLKRYDITKPDNVRIGEWVGKGYRRADFHDVWARYVTAVTDVTDPIYNSERNLSDSPREAAASESPPSLFPQNVGNIGNRSNGPPVCDHCGQAGGELLRVTDGGAFRLLHRDCHDAAFEARK